MAIDERYMEQAKRLAREKYPDVPLQSIRIAAEFAAYEVRSHDGNVIGHIPYAAVAQAVGQFP
jgi:3-mercaptopyruvate sulfurtransferase SseA